MPRRKGSKSKRPYPHEARKKKSLYSKLIDKLGKEAVNELDIDALRVSGTSGPDIDSEPDEFYYSDDNEPVHEEFSEQQEQDQQQEQTDEINKKQNTQNDLLAEMTGLKQKLSQYEEQLNEYRDLAKEHRQFLAEQKALKRKLTEEQELNRRAELLAEQKMNKIRQSKYKYESDALSALLF